MVGIKIKYTNEEIAICPLCSSPQKPLLHLSCRDNLVSGAMFQITACATCSHLVTNPRPSQDDIGAFYTSDKYVSHHDKPQSLQDRVYMMVRALMAARKRRVVARWSDNRYPFLDIGCGTGSFLDTLNKAGYKTLGVEPADTARHAARDKGFDVYKTLKELPNKHDGSLGGISMWHVLEHVYDVKTHLQYCYRMLMPGACLFIAIPIWQSFDAAYYKQHWAAYDLPRHIHHFSRKSLFLLAGQTGFVSTRTYTMPFDSYYISLLSEQHAKALPKILALPRAMTIATISNLLAATGMRPASSELFVFKKPNNKI